MTQFTDRFLYTPPTPNVSKKFVEKSITKPQDDLSYGANLYATRHLRLFEEPGKHPRVGIGKLRSSNVAFLPMECYADPTTKNTLALSPYRKQCITLPQLNSCYGKQVKSLNVLSSSTRPLTDDGVNPKKNKLPGEMLSDTCPGERCSIKLFENSANKVTPYRWPSDSLADTRRPVNTNNLKSCIFYQSPKPCPETRNANNSRVKNLLSPGVAVTTKQPQWLSLLKDVADVSTARIAHIPSPLSSSTRCSSFSSVSLASEALLSRACQIRKSLKPTTFAARENTNKSKICSTNTIKDSSVSQCQNVQEGMNPRLEDSPKNELRKWNKGHSETNSEGNSGPWCSMSNSLSYCDGNKKVSGQIKQGREPSKPREMCQKENVPDLGRSHETDVHSLESMFGRQYGVNETLCKLAKDFQNDVFLKTCRQKRACEQVNLEKSLLSQGFHRAVEKNKPSSFTKTPQLYGGNTLQEDMLFQKCCSTCERSHITKNHEHAVKDASFCNNFKAKEPEKKKKCCVQYVPSQNFPHKSVDTLKSRQESFVLNGNSLKEKKNSRCLPSVRLQSMRPIVARNRCHWTNVNGDDLCDENISREHGMCEKGKDHCLQKHAQFNSGSSDLMSPMLSNPCEIEERASICPSEEDGVSCFTEKDCLKDVVKIISSECSSVIEDLDRGDSHEMDENFLKTNYNGKKKRGFATQEIDTKTWKKPNPLNKESVNNVQHLQDDLWKHYYHYRFQSSAAQPKVKPISKNGLTDQPKSFYNQDIPPYSYETTTHHLVEKNEGCCKSITPLSHVEHTCSTCLDTDVVLKVLQKIAEENIKESAQNNKTINSTHWTLGDYFKKKQSLDSSETRHYLLRFGVTLTLTFLVIGVIVMLIFLSLRRHPKVQNHSPNSFADDMFNLSSFEENFGNDFYLTSNQMM